MLIHRTMAWEEIWNKDYLIQPIRSKNVLYRSSRKRGGGTKKPCMFLEMNWSFNQWIRNKKQVKQ